MKIEIELKFNPRDRVHFGSAGDLKGTIVKICSQDGECRLMYLIEEEDESHNWWREYEAYPYGTNEAAEKT